MTMNKEEQLIEIMVDILEMDEVTLETELIDWDSIAMISFIADVGDTFDVEISTDELRDAETVADLFKLI